MPPSGGSVGGAIDKGTLDGILSNKTAQGWTDARMMMAELGRVMKPGAVWISVCVSPPDTFQRCLIPQHSSEAVLFKYEKSDRMVIPSSSTPAAQDGTGKNVYIHRAVRA